MPALLEEAGFEEIDLKLRFDFEPDLELITDRVTSRFSELSVGKATRFSRGLIKKLAGEEFK